MVPGIPFLLSLTLSLCTAGTTVTWQDSGLYLTAVHEMSVLYPPGFVLYQVLCKAWTKVLFFVDFTLAVHLFSSLCAALAAATMALAARDLVRAKGRFKVLDDPGESTAAAAGVIAGILLASGYTFWAAGIYAKGYSLFYLVLAQILLRMIRADETGNPREFTSMAAWIGLAWATHPSAALLGPVFVAYLVLQRSRIGAAGIAWRTAVSAACAVGPFLLLPALAARASIDDLGKPDTLSSWVPYLLGTRFTTQPHVFGFLPSRVASFGQYLWEEMLAVGLILMTIGLLRVVRTHRSLTVGLFLWIVPFSIFTILFKIEGQHDCWFVAAWLPLTLVQAVGACFVLQRFGRAAAFGAGAIGVACAVLVNVPLLSQVSYRLAEDYGRLHLQNLDRDAVLILSGDDTIATTRYLQAVKGYRPDVVIVSATRLVDDLSGLDPWYLGRLVGLHPELRVPDGRLFFPPEYSAEDRVRLATATFLNANAGGPRPIFSSLRPVRSTLAPEIELVPAGPVWKLGRAGEIQADPRYWKNFPVDERTVIAQFRRERGQTGVHAADYLVMYPERYEQRLLEALLNAKRILAEWHFERGSYSPAGKLFEAILEFERDPGRRDVVTHYLGVCYDAQLDDAGAERMFLLNLAHPGEGWIQASAHYHLGKILERRGKTAEARGRFRQALAVPGIEPSLRLAIEKELAPK